MPKKPMTYAEAGVDIEKEDAAVGALAGALSFARTGIGAPLGAIGHFAGLVDFGEHALCLCTDGVGSKMEVARALGKWDTVGIDCMAMNVNDAICVGAEPIAFVDYLAVEDPDASVTRAIGVGLEEGARQANVSLVGGETATLPGIVKGFDLAGTCLAYAKKDQLVTGEKIQPGDILIGMASTGIHSNGYTLARKAVEAAGLAYTDAWPETWQRGMGMDPSGGGNARDARSAKEPREASQAPNPSDAPNPIHAAKPRHAAKPSHAANAGAAGHASDAGDAGSANAPGSSGDAPAYPGMSVGEVLLIPTRIYVKPIMALLHAGVPVHGLSHITGSGLRKLRRINQGVRYDVIEPLPVPPVFAAIQAWGGVEDHEMYKAFNMGMGFVVVVPAEAADEALRVLHEHAEYHVKVVGEVSQGSGVHHPVGGQH